jgi:hypothetical protein
LSNRLKVEATYYSRVSHDALIDRPLASEVGIVSRQENIGAVRNSGIEGSVSMTAIENRLSTWELTLSGSVNRNRLERIGGGISVITGATATDQSREGYPLLSRFVRPILGYADANGDGIIQEREVRVGDTLVYVGQTLPPRQLTASSSLALFNNRVRVTTQFDYRGGHLLANFTEANRCSAFLSDCLAVNDKSAPLADQARAVALNSVAYGRTQAGYLEDGSFVRWRELGVTYVAPDAVARRLGARAATLSISGRNLRLFTKYSGVDPEVNSSVGVLEGYSENPTAPVARYWLLRVNLGL